MADDTTIPNAGDKLYLGFPSGGSPELAFVVSLVKSVRHWPNLRWGYAASSRLVNNRNTLARQFLESGREWFLMVDDDMLFEPVHVDMAVARAESGGAKVWGALAFGDDGGAMFSTLLVKKEIDGERAYLRGSNWPVNGVAEVDATGTAMLLVHRDVMLEVERKFKSHAPYNWFEERTHKGRSYGEDVVFSERILKCGFKLYVDCAWKSGHIKPVILTEDLYDRMLRDKLMIVGPHAGWLSQVFTALNINVRPPGMTGFHRWRIASPVEGEEIPSDWYAAQVVDTSALPPDPPTVVHYILLTLRKLGINRNPEQIVKVLQALGIPSVGVELNVTDGDLLPTDLRSEIPTGTGSGVGGLSGSDAPPGGDSPGQDGVHH